MSGASQLSAHNAPPNEIDLVLPFVSWNRVHEREILHRESEPPNCARKCFQALQLVAIVRGSLELEVPA